MPIVAIGAAIAADVVAGVGVAAAGLTLTTALEVTAAVGATLGAVGVVTHNKALTYVGAGLGLVGGIGSLASAAGVFGEAASAPLFGASPAASTADAAAAGTSSDIITSMAPDLADQNAGAAEFGNAASPGSMADAAATRPDFLGPGAASSPADNLGFNGAGTNGGQVGVNINSTDPAGAALKTPGGQDTATVTAPTTAPAPTNTGLPPINPEGGNTGWTEGADPYATGGAAKDTGTLGSIMNFVKNNQMLAYGAVQAGGQFLSGLTSTLTPAQVGALNSQAAANQAAANLTAQQTANLAQPRSTATLAPVTGKPGTPIVSAPPAGLINGAPQVNVTGVPA